MHMKTSTKLFQQWIKTMSWMITEAGSLGKQMKG